MKLIYKKNQKVFSLKDLSRSGSELLKVDVGNNYEISVLKFKDIQKFLKGATDEIGYGLWGFGVMVDSKDIYEEFDGNYPEINNAKYYVLLEDFNSKINLSFITYLMKDSNDQNYDILKYIDHWDHTKDINGVFRQGFSDYRDSLRFFADWNLKDLTDEYKKLLSAKSYKDSDITHSVAEVNVFGANGLYCIPSQKHGIFFDDIEYNKFINGAKNITKKLPSRKELLDVCCNLVKGKMDESDPIKIRYKIADLNNEIKSIQESIDSYNKDLSLLDKMKNIK